VAVLARLATAADAPAYSFDCISPCPAETCFQPAMRPEPSPVPSTSTAWLSVGSIGRTSEFQRCSPGLASTILSTCWPQRDRLGPAGVLWPRLGLTLMAARSTFARAIRRSTIDSSAHAGAPAASRMALLARDISETRPANLPLPTPEPPLLSFFSGTGLVALALIAAPKGAGSPASCSSGWHFSTTLAEQAKGVKSCPPGR
jgi:hypothetical protein